MTDGAPTTRLERAKVVRDAVIEIGRTRGCWRPIDLGDERSARYWEVEGPEWQAHITTRFSGLSREVRVSGYDGAVLLQSAPPKHDDVIVDVYHPEAGKVLSIGSTGIVDTLIGMQPGPWEQAFGLPRREWSPATARRLASRWKHA